MLPHLSASPPWAPERLLPTLFFPHKYPQPFLHIQPTEDFSRTRGHPLFCLFLHPSPACPNTIPGQNVPLFLQPSTSQPSPSCPCLSCLKPRSPPALTHVQLTGPSITPGGVGAPETKVGWSALRVPQTAQHHDEALLVTKPLHIPDCQAFPSLSTPPCPRDPMGGVGESRDRETESNPGIVLRPQLVVVEGSKGGRGVVWKLGRRG